MIGASAMLYNQHFPYFISPNVVYQKSGASGQWPVTPALFLLLVSTLLSPSTPNTSGRAWPGVWILRSAKDKDPTSYLPELQRVLAVKLVELPSKSRTVHKDSCWEEAHRDTYPMPFKAQLCFISRQLTLQRCAESRAAKFSLDLHPWERR